MTAIVQTSPHCMALSSSRVSRRWTVFENYLVLSFIVDAGQIQHTVRSVSAQPFDCTAALHADMNLKEWRGPPFGKTGYGRPESRFREFLWKIQRQKDALEQPEGRGQELSETANPQEQLGPFERRIAQLLAARKARRRAVQLWHPLLLNVLLPWLSVKQLKCLSLVCRPLSRPAQAYLIRTVLRGYEPHRQDHELFQFSTLYIDILFKHACSLNSDSILGYFPLGDELSSIYHNYFYE